MKKKMVFGSAKLPRMFIWVKALCMLFILNVLPSMAMTSEESKKMDISMKNVSLVEVFRYIRSISDYRFVYDSDAVKKVTSISIDMKNATIDVIMDHCLKGTDFTYVVEENLVIVKERKIKAVEEKASRKIEGKVIDKNKRPIPGVTVVISGTKLGVSTDVSGKFSLVISQKDSLVLVFSFVGMKTKHVAVDLKKNLPITVVMEEDAREMEELVVTGYQEVKRRSMAGSTSRVKGSDLVMNGTQTLEQALQGQLPGVMIINQSGLTGTRQKVRVRGTSTLVGNPDPVWVVDGIIQEDPIPFNTMDLANMSGNSMDMIKDFVGGAISWLNPNDIEDITVLKDASATAIYGVKAANGVIVITTKKGERGRLSLSYNGNLSLSSKLTYKNMELMDSKERVEASRDAFENGSVFKSEPKVGYTALALAYKRREITFEEFNRGVKKLETNNTDWFDILFQVPFSHSHTISVSGGSERTTYRASLGISDQRNTAKGNSQSIYTGSLNVSSTFWNQLIVSIGVAGSVTKTKAFADIDPYKYATTTSRAIPFYNEDGSLYFYDNGGGLYNIVNELNNSGNKNTTSMLKGTLNVRWTLGYGLTLSSIFGYNFSSSYGESWYTERSNYIRQIRGYEFGACGFGDELFINSPLPFGGELNVNENRNHNYTWRNQLEYSKNFGLHALTLMLGEESRSNKYDGYSQRSYGYMPDRGKSFANVPLTIGVDKKENSYARSNPVVTDREANYLSFYGNLSYMFDDRYAFNASIRMDASNRFGQDRSARYQPVWSVGLRWNLTREHWLENQNVLNDVSLRASYGYQGNVAENVGPDLITKYEEVDEETGEYRMVISRLPAPNLKWEKNKSVNLGIDFSILDRRINGSFEYYYKRTEDMITSREVPFENGVTSMVINGGNMKNSGWDLSFSLIPVRTKDFVWSLSMNTSKVYNELDSDLEPTGKWQDVVNGEFNKKGYAVSSFWAFRFTGLNPEHGGPQFDFTGADTEAANLDVTEYMDYAGKLEPDFTAGLSTSLRYKRLSLYANFYLSTGNQKFLASPYGGVEYGDASKMADETQNLSTQLCYRWRKSGDEKLTNIPALPNSKNSGAIRPFHDYYASIFPYDAWSYSNIRVVDAWYLRCNNITLSYTLPVDMIKRFAQDLSFSFSVSNPFQIVSKDFQGRDPEVASGKQPLSRNYSFSVNVSF